VIELAMDELGSSSCDWSREQDIAFENALANFPHGWERVVANVTGKSLNEIKRHYVDLIDDVNHIESGYVPLPVYNEIRSVKKRTETSRSVQERRKGIPWTEAEHRLIYLCFDIIKSRSCLDKQLICSL
jgi:hypothetical protein